MVPSDAKDLCQFPPTEMGNDKDQRLHQLSSIGMGNDKYKIYVYSQKMGRVVTSSKDHASSFLRERPRQNARDDICHLFKETDKLKHNKLYRPLVTRHTIAKVSQTYSKLGYKAKGYPIYLAKRLQKSLNKLQQA